MSTPADDPPDPRRVTITWAGVLVGVVGTLAVIAAAVLVGVLAVSLWRPGLPPGARSSPDPGSLEALPSPRLDGAVPLEEALARRRSVRSFTGVPLTAAEIGQLLWAAQGVTDAWGHRTAPSAGALYPIELDAVTADGVARYVAGEHALVRRGSADLRGALRLAALDQAVVGEAPLVIVVSGVVDRTAARYGPERAQRYVTLEAGHAAQNILLQAVALDLGAVSIGAFADDEVHGLLSLAEGEQPLYLIPVGHPE